MTKEKKDINKMDFESALLDLEDIVERLGNEKVDLEEMINLYQRGVELKEHCAKKIQDAKMKVEVIMKNKKD